MKSHIYSYRIFFLLFSISLLATTVLKAQKFPVYRNLPLVKPAGLPRFENGDFKIDKNRLKLYPTGFVCGNKQALEKLYDYLLHNDTGKTVWIERTSAAAKVLNRWDFNKAASSRYVYAVSQLQELSLIYMIAGQKELGQFIHGHMMQITQLPLDFWLHAELRGQNRNHPVGGLETAALSSTVAIVASSAPDLFSPNETEAIDKALKEKGLDPCINFLSGDKSNNWLAVVSAGAYVAAKYLHDQQGILKSFTSMTNYINGSIETDGSYGEGKGYFDYPIGSLFPAVLAMNPSDRISFFSASKLRYSASWMVYPYLFSSNNASKNTILHSGDNSYSGYMDPKIGDLLSFMFQDPLSIWLANRFVKLPDLRELLFTASVLTKLPEAESPEQQKLPLIKSFENGDAFIRSSWKEDAIVLMMRSGNGSLLHYSHQHPEIGSIGLGAYGEYMIVSTGSASYRSPLHYQWDMTTRAANTITIDEKNQLFPKKKIYVWNTFDVSGFWEDGDPKAEILQCKSGEIADVLVNEMAPAYHVPMDCVRRSVLFVKQSGYFLIVDKIKAKEGIHTYSSRLHLNNNDSQGKLKEMTSGTHWLFTRPLATLDIHIFSDQPTASKIEKGYMHGLSRDYSPGGINEGKLGSSIELEVSNANKSNEQVFYTVIYPAKKGNIVPEVKQIKNKIIVGEDTFTFANGKCVIDQKGKSESYAL